VRGEKGGSSEERNERAVTNVSSLIKRETRKILMKSSTVGFNRDVLLITKG